MDVQFWIMLAGIVGAGVVIVWRKRRSRRAFAIDHVRVELHEAHIVDDHGTDAVWRAAISMTNHTRRPRVLPVLAARATVTERHRVYLAEVYLDSDAPEVNPGDVALAWVEFVLPAGARSNRVDIVQLRDPRSARPRRFVLATGGPLPLAV